MFKYRQGMDGEGISAVQSISGENLILRLELTCLLIYIGEDRTDYDRAGS